MNDKNIIAIIPARMGSSRFPGKPLADICGRAMIFHVYHRTKLSRCLNEVYIATCDEVIETYCKEHNMNVVMTKDTHERCSDRCAEAMLKIEQMTSQKTDIVVMVQGDEPLVYPEMIDSAVLALLNEDETTVVNLMAEIKTQAEHEDANEVKVVIDENGYALYFSREPIPSRKKGAVNIPMLKQVCIIPFTRAGLLGFNAMTSTPLECIESVDMLRLLEHGKKVKMVKVMQDIYSVDTKQDLYRVSEMMRKDNLYKFFY